MYGGPQVQKTGFNKGFYRLINCFFYIGQKKVDLKNIKQSINASFKNRIMIDK